MLLRLLFGSILFVALILTAIAHPPLFGLIAIALIAFVIVAAILTDRRPTARR